MKNSRTHYLSDLLPFDPKIRKNGDLPGSLKEYQMIVRAFSEAVRLFKCGAFEHFDSLVGENACEIRAIWISLIATFKTSTLILTLENQLRDISNKIEALLFPRTISSLMNTNLSFRDLLEKENLDITLQIDQIFLILSYLLSESKMVPSYDEYMQTLWRKDVASPKALKKFGEISSTFAWNLVSRLRKLLSEASVYFVREKAFSLQDKSLMKMVSSDFTITHNGFLFCTPMFWTYKTLLASALQENIPLIFHVKFLKQKETEYVVLDEDCLLFKSNSDQYIAIEPDEIDLQKPACVFQGVAVCTHENIHSFKLNWKNSFLQHSVIDVILAGAADHRQYPDVSFDYLVHDLQDKEYNHYRCLAKKEGFSIENPSKFFIQHVYASQIGNFSKILGKTKTNFALSSV